MLQVLWMAPFYSGGGYCSEAHAFMSSIQEHILYTNTTNITFSISQHGDTYRQGLFESLTSNEQERLSTLDIHRHSFINNFWFTSPPSDVTKSATTTIAICHSEPGAWNAPYPYYHTFTCPPSYVDIKIGRTMFETNQLPNGWVDRLNYMDEVWVPTEFSKQIFLKAGVRVDKIEVIPEPVDTDFFSPQNISSLFDHNTSMHYTDGSISTVTNKQMKYNADLHRVFKLSQQNNNFMLLFVGKWETRKGLKLLLRAYYQEFIHKSGSDSCNNSNMNVHLVILTSQYHSSEVFIDEIFNYLISSESFIMDESNNTTYDNFSPCCSEGSTVTSTSSNTTANFFSCHNDNISSTLRQYLNHFIHVLTDIDQFYMPYLYSAVDVLVIPSHGEGWGRPHVEAMACGTPVIATNWSGVTAYLTEDNGYPLQMENELITAEGWPGHEWAHPSENHLRQLMRHVVRDKILLVSKSVSVGDEEDDGGNRLGYTIPTITNDSNVADDLMKRELNDTTAQSQSLSPSPPHYHTSDLYMKGQQARRDMITYYSLSVMGELMLQHFERVRNKFKPDIS